MFGERSSLSLNLSLCKLDATFVGETFLNFDLFCAVKIFLLNWLYTCYTISSGYASPLLSSVIISHETCLSIALAACSDIIKISLIQYFYGLFSFCVYRHAFLMALWTFWYFRNHTLLKNHFYAHIFSPFLAFVTISNINALPPQSL